MDHERLDVYQVVRQYNRALNRMLRRLDTTGWSKRTSSDVRADRSD
jgi:hypothetical protein